VQLVCFYFVFTTFTTVGYGSSTLSTPHSSTVSPWQCVSDLFRMKRLRMKTRTNIHGMPIYCETNASGLSPVKTHVTSSALTYPTIQAFAVLFLAANFAVLFLPESLRPNATPPPAGDISATTTAERVYTSLNPRRPNFEFCKPNTIVLYISPRLTLITCAEVLVPNFIPNR
jgi:hypothetical protein